MTACEAPMVVSDAGTRDPRECGERAAYVCAIDGVRPEWRPDPITGCAAEGWYWPVPWDGGLACDPGDLFYCESTWEGCPP